MYGIVCKNHKINVLKMYVWQQGKGCKALAAKGCRFHILSPGAEYPSYATGAIIYYFSFYDASIFIIRIMTL